MRDKDHTFSNAHRNSTNKARAGLLQAVTVNRKSNINGNILL